MFLLATALIRPPAFAGDIPGMPSPLLPTIERNFAISFANDFLGSGGSVDDFRTQQIVIVAEVGDKWTATVDHSILTLTQFTNPGRIDQLSASLGYRLLDDVSDDHINRISIGGGLRSIGEFSGEKMQNGFHRLIGSNIDQLPYVNTKQTDATAWLDAQTYREFRVAGSWTNGYWLRAGSLLTTDGQWDNSVSALLVASRQSTDVWFGLRQDWRSGYDRDSVQAETARAEQDTAVVLGVRFGALVLETVQQLNNDASYGQVMLVSTGKKPSDPYTGVAKTGIEFGIVVPDAELRLAGRYAARLFTNTHSTWRESLFVDFRYGQPQYQNDSDLFVDVRQIGIGVGWERPVARGSDWLRFYGALGAGWRSEQLNRETTMVNEQSSSVDGAVVLAAAGIRFFAATLGGRWRYRIQLGMNATVPISDERVQLGIEQFTLQKPILGIMLGMTFDAS